MSGLTALAAPALKPTDILNATSIAKPTATNDKTRARAAAQDFESVFINSMLEQMYTGIDGEGPFGGTGATAVWRSMLTQQYSKAMAKAGGLGIADHVYRSLLSHQEARS